MTLTEAHAFALNAIDEILDSSFIPPKEPRITYGDLVKMSRDELYDYCMKIIKQLHKTYPNAIALEVLALRYKNEFRQTK